MSLIMLCSSSKHYAYQNTYMPSKYSTISRCNCDAKRWVSLFLNPSFNCICLHCIQIVILRPVHLVEMQKNIVSKLIYSKAGCNQIITYLSFLPLCRPTIFLCNVLHGRVLNAYDTILREVGSLEKFILGTHDFFHLREI